MRSKPVSRTKEGSQDFVSPLELFDNVCIYVIHRMYLHMRFRNSCMTSVCLSVTTAGNFRRCFSLRHLNLDRGQIKQSGCTPSYSHAHALCQSMLCLFLPPDGRCIGGRDLACHKRKQITSILTR